jgi:hypothetical protein
MQYLRGLLPGFCQSQRLRWLGSLLLAAAVLFTVGGSSQVSAASHAPATQDPSVAGKWNLKVTFPDGHTEPSQVIFGEDGVFVNLTPAPGGGRWFSTGGRSFRDLFAETIVNASGVYTALVEVEQKGTLSEDGKSFTASGNGYVYDPSTGKLLAVNHTTTVATRVPR